MERVRTVGRKKRKEGRRVLDWREGGKAKT